MSKIILQEGDIAYAVIDLKLKKYRCKNGLYFKGEKHLVLVPYNQKIMHIEQLKPIYQVNGLEEYVFTNWKSAKIYQIKKYLRIFTVFFKITN